MNCTTKGCVNGKIQGLFEVYDCPECQTRQAPNGVRVTVKNPGGLIWDRDSFTVNQPAAQIGKTQKFAERYGALSGWASDTPRLLRVDHSKGDFTLDDEPIGPQLTAEVVGIDAQKISVPTKAGERIIPGFDFKLRLCLGTEIIFRRPSSWAMRNPRVRVGNKVTLRLEACNFGGRHWYKVKTL